MYRYKIYFIDGTDIILELNSLIRVHDDKPIFGHRNLNHDVIIMKQYIKYIEEL